MKISDGETGFGPAGLRTTKFQPDDLPCNNATNYWIYSLIFSVSFIFLLSFLERRNNPTRCGSRPSLVYPVNLLDYKTDNIGFAAAFGSMASHCWNLFWNSNSAYSLAPVWAKSLVVMVQVVYIGFQYYPMFVCLQTPWVIVGSTVGLCFSGFWFWLYLSAVIKCPTSADDSSSLTGQNIAIMLPVLACLLVLMLRFIVKLVKHVLTLIRQRVTPCRLRAEEQQAERLAKRCNIDYVKQLLKPACYEPVTDYGKIQTPTRLHKFRVMLSRWLYLNDPNFKYSPRMVATFTVAVICSYQFGIIMVLLIYQLEKIIPSMVPGQTNSSNSSDFDDNSEFIVDIQLALQVFTVSAMVSFILSSLLTLFGIFQILTTYRQNLKRMFKGDFAHLPFKRDGRYPQFVMSDSLSYAGSQIAYVIWGYIIAFAVMVATCFLIAYAVILPIFDVISRDNLKFVGNLLSGVIIMQVFMTLQKIFCRVLLHRRPARNDDGTETTVAVLAIDNRKIYHNMSYFLLFFYIVLGIFGCLVTIFKGIALGVFYLARMDKCGLIQGFETYDKGYMYYISFLHVEECHRHPVLLVFCDILTQNMKKRDIRLHEYGSEPPHISQIDRARLISVEGHLRARNRWLKAYTLLRNPSLRKASTEDDFDRLVDLESSTLQNSSLLKIRTAEA